MILQRYLLKDIFSHTGAVGLVFLLVILASRSIQYLEQVSRGELSLELVFWVVLFRLPEFLELIIPFSFFLSMVLVIGRLCSDNEMIILEQNGYSNSRLLKIFFVASLYIKLEGFPKKNVLPPIDSYNFKTEPAQICFFKFALVSTLS